MIKNEIKMNSETISISDEVSVIIYETNTMPIVIQAAGAFVNVDFDELEKIYLSVLQCQTIDTNPHLAANISL